MNTNILCLIETASRRGGFLVRVVGVEGNIPDSKSGAGGSNPSPPAKVGGVAQLGRATDL